MEVWSESQRGDLRRGQSLALDSGYWVEHLVSVPSQQVFVAACNDLSLRVFSDQKQGMEFLYRADCLGSVVCTCYCKETGELLTGSMGLITFWGFWTTPQVPGNFQTFLMYFMQTATLYALCNRSIRTFDLVGKKEHRSFSGHGQGTLRCVSPDWGQRYIFTGDMTGFVQVWSSDTRSLLREFRAHTGSVSAVLTRRSTRTLLSSSPDGWVKEWSSSGDLLLKLFLDDLGGVRSLLSLGERRVLCHSPSSFSVWGLQDLCVPFNNPGCGMQLLRRVESGPGRAQILAVSQDGIARLICPASGELLAFSWPFLILDQAIGFAFNPGRKELFVASGRPEVLVLDTALCPCPAKQIIQTAKDQNVDDSVLCLEAVMVGGASPQLCLVFSGLSNGKLQLLSPNRLHCPARKAHDGAVLGMSSLSGPRTQLCCYGSDKQLSVWEVEVGEAHVEVVPLARVCCSSGLVLFRLLSGLVFAVSPDYSLLFFSLPDGACFRTNRNPPTSISCIDCNATLGLVVVSGPGGTVELWETRGVQLAEIRLGRAVSQVCFANARGDLMVCFGSQIYIISGLRFLPARLLQRILDLAPPDDILQDPLPFRPHSQSCYDISNIPQQFLKPGLATPGLTEAPVAVEDLTLDMVDAEVNLEEEPMEGARYCQTVKCQTSVEPPRLNALVNWPVAPDGFLPNSILRNWKPGQEPPEAILPNVAKALLRTFCQSEEELSQVSLILDKAKEARLNKPIAMPKLFDTPPEEEENISGKGNEVLKSIAESLWLVYRPDVDLAEVVKALMLSMESTDSDVYLNCTEALLVLFQTYDIPPAVMRNVNVCLLKHIQKGNPCGKRLGGMKILNQLGLLQDKDLHLLVEVILDPAMELRKTVKYLLSHVYGIENKTTLLSRIQASEDPPKKLLNQLDENLSEDLELNSSKDASTVQRRPRPRRGSGTACFVTLIVVIFKCNIWV
uniref:Uncharacterized protein n=1 Tax=Esox lucius TaxID=8010 RepID=A0A3P8YEM4_ESOLU